FATHTEGGLLETYCIDQTGQILRWKEASGKPEKIGKPLLPLLKDSPQGITYENGKIWVWSSSSLIGLMPSGEIVCEFSRPPMAQPPTVRILGAAVSLAAWAGAAFLTYKYAQEAFHLSTEPASFVSYFKRSLRASAYAIGATFAELVGDVVWKQAVERRRLRAQQMADIAFLVGMQDNHVYLYAVERPTCKVILQKDLGKPRLFQSPEYEIDPIDQRVFALEGNTLRAFSIE
ncbi:MAG: hypothetical protein RMJ66_08585, partial [Bacteroidia bacterium]|nr:hypothetical protein [Bacteroidia bacterium]